MNNILPNGTELRDLLTNSFLTTTHLNNLLKTKGIITQNKDRNASIPIYMSLILSPIEFESLNEKNNVKEEKEKSKLITIPINGDVELGDLCLDLNIHDIIKDNLTYAPNYEIIGNPIMSVDDDEINLEIIIKSISNIRGWANRESFHNASISLKKDNDKLIGTKKFTSKDSEKVIDFAISSYEQKLKDHNYLKNDKKISKILFNNFTNINRFKYFYSFTQDFKNVMTFEEITDIDIIPDTESIDSLSNELKNLLNNVNNLSLKGKKLQEHLFITEKSNHEFIQLKAIKLKYKFDKIGCDGSCIIEFEFPEKSNMDLSEFQFNISNLSIGKKEKELINSSLLSKKIKETLYKHQLDKFEEFKIED